MGPYQHGLGAPEKSWTSEIHSPFSAPEIDGLLAGAGYRVRSSDLRYVAQRLEQLDSAMLTVGDGIPSDAIQYNPSDLASWVDSMLSDLSPTTNSNPIPSPIPDTWTNQIHDLPPPQISLVAEEEDSGIRLVHLLMTCAESIQRGDSRLAGTLIEEMKRLLTRVSTGFGIGKVAGYFVDALFRRLYSPTSFPSTLAEDEILYHHFYEASPYLKFAHFTANQAILEALDGHDRVHVIDFNLMHGLQWPALIQALALRPGGPPSLRLTGIGPPSPDGRDSLREIGLRLAELARSVNVGFSFRGIAANRLDDVKPWMLHVAPGEAVAVNSVFQLHRLLTEQDSVGPIDSVLSWILGLRPKIVTVVEQEADHNKPAFLDRFTEALFYYSTMFDSLEGGRSGAQNWAALAEVYLQREICNIICREGTDRVERHEPLVKWRTRLSWSGLIPVHLGSNAFKQASMLLMLFSGEGYSVEEVDGSLTLGWHSRSLMSVSAWRADDDVAQPPIRANLIFNSSNNNANTCSSIITKDSNCSSSSNNSCSPQSVNVL